MSCKAIFWGLGCYGRVPSLQGGFVVWGSLPQTSSGGAGGTDLLWEELSSRKRHFPAVGVGHPHEQASDSLRKVTCLVLEA